MVAPLIVAGARAAGTQLARQSAARAAGAQLAKKEASQVAGSQLAKNAPNIAGKPALNTQMAPNQMKGPVYGYTEPKVVQNDIEMIKDWQGVKDDKTDKNKNTPELAGQRLDNTNISNVKKTVETTEEPTESNKITQNTVIQKPVLMNPYLERPIAEKRPRLDGAGYWIVLVTVIMKDIIDLIFELFGFVFDILVITSPIGILLEIIDWILDLLVFVIIQGFYMLNGVPFTPKKLGFQATTLSLEAVPFLGALPMNAASFVYQTMKINKERKQEEEEEQKRLDEQFERNQIAMREQVLNNYNQQMAQIEQLEIESQKQSVVQEEKIEKPKGNEWQEMVDQSNQNITKTNAYA